MAREDAMLEAEERRRSLRRRVRWPMSIAEAQVSGKGVGRAGGDEEPQSGIFPSSTLSHLQRRTVAIANRRSLAGIILQTMLVGGVKRQTEEMMYGWSNRGPGRPPPFPWASSGQSGLPAADLPANYSSRLLGAFLFGRPPPRRAPELHAARTVHRITQPVSSATHYY